MYLEFSGHKLRKTFLPLCWKNSKASHILPNRNQLWVGSSWGALFWLHVLLPICRSWDSLMNASIFNYKDRDIWQRTIKTFCICTLILGLESLYGRMCITWFKWSNSDFFPPMWHRLDMTHEHANSLKAHEFWYSLISFEPHSYESDIWIGYVYLHLPCKWTDRIFPSMWVVLHWINYGGKWGRLWWTLCCQVCSFSGEFGVLLHRFNRLFFSPWVKVFSPSLPGSWFQGRRLETSSYDQQIGLVLFCRSGNPVSGSVCLPWVASPSVWCKCGYQYGSLLKDDLTWSSRGTKIGFSQKIGHQDYMQPTELMSGIGCLIKKICKMCSVGGTLGTWLGTIVL